MTFLYNLGISLYTLLAQLAAIFNPKARLFVRGRKNWLSGLQSRIDPGARYLWFHCASLGEFEQGRPVIEAIRQQFPEYQIALTFYSPSGYEIRKNYPQADLVCYLPADTRRNARRFLDTLRPEKAFFIKYEFWFHYITGLQERQIPLFLVSGIFRENQVFFRQTPWGKWYARLLTGFEHFFVQDAASAQLLQQAGITRVTVSGDTRFDRVAAIAAAAKNIPLVEKFKDGKPVVVAGSSWKPDEELLTRFINQHAGLKFIIAPHEVSQVNLTRLEQLLKKPAVRFSQASENEVQNFEVLIIDSIGLLSSLYRYGDFAYIGGGFGVGIHNILEAATFGLPVVFGPNYQKFREARELVAAGGAFSIATYEALEQIFQSLSASSANLQAAAQTAAGYVQNNTGATEIIIKRVFC